MRTMRPYRSTIAGMMAVVALASSTALRLASADFLAWVLARRGRHAGRALPCYGSRGWGRRFWAGFEASGLGLLLGDRWLPCRPQVVNGWAYRVTEGIYGSMLGLPADAFQWCLEHGLVIDPRKPLKVYEVVVVFEVAYGLPMPVLAGVGGALASSLGTRRARRPPGTPC